MTEGARASSAEVFINCPFDDLYKPIFEALARLRRDTLASIPYVDYERIVTGWLLETSHAETKKRRRKKRKAN